MKLNSPESIKAAGEVFRNYGGSWSAARAAGTRDVDGILVIPRAPARLNGSQGDDIGQGSSRKGG